MAKGVEKSEFVENPRFDGVGVRDKDPAGAPSNVSSPATPRIRGKKSVQHFEFGQKPRSALPERPSTSGGTASRRIVDKRQTRDDIPIKALDGQGIDARNFDFPLPVPSISSEVRRGSSGESSLPHSTTSVATTVEPGKPSNTMEIGMAIGSPSQRPAAWGKHVRFDSTGRTDSLESTAPEIDWKDPAAESQPKPSKWKTLGGLFGKKARPVPAFYQLQNVVEATMAQAENESHPPSVSADRSRGRSQSSSQRKPKPQKPDLKRAATVPTNPELESNRNAPKGFQRTPELRLEGGPMLNVDIPSVEMDRYSVMFGSVLQSNSQTSSLLARRQATLDKLKTVNEAIAEHERREADLKAKLPLPRRASSPQPTGSPSFSLFPHARYTDHSQQGRRPPFGLHRSNTSPAAVSPVHLDFPVRAIETDEASRSLREEVHRIMTGSPPLIAPVAKSSTLGTPNAPSATLNASWNSNSSNLDLGADSPTSSVEEIHDPAPLKPRLTEPDWEMVSRAENAEGPTSLPTPPASNTSMESTRSEHGLTFSDTYRSNEHLPSPPRSAVVTPKIPPKSSFKAPTSAPASAKSLPAPIITSPRRAPSMKTPPAVALQTAVDALAQAEAAAESAASISIARQISVSQRQRQLLVPINTRPAAGSGSVRAARLAAAAAKDAKVGETLKVNDGGKPMTPTLVSVGPAPGQPGHIHRKSERAVIEDA